jgi:hypothetical protein
MTGTDENDRPEVPAGAKPEGEVYGRWPWVERTVWKERMLETLERGPRNGANRYFHELGLLCLEQAWASTPPAP